MGRELFEKKEAELNKLLDTVDAYIRWAGGEGHDSVSFIQDGEEGGISPFVDVNILFLLTIAITDN